MKKCIPLITCLCCSLMLSAQSPEFAENWTKADCDDVEHTLFDELDAGKCVILEFAMLPICASCINAAHNIEPIVAENNALYDNRVYYYTIGYDDSYTCDDLTDWKEDNELNPTAQFSKGAGMLAYYGSFGMPTIVIAGRETHEVFYYRQGFFMSELDEIDAAIKEALNVEAPVHITKNEVENNINIYPNPASENFQIELNTQCGNVSAELYDLAGNSIAKVYNGPAAGNTSVSFDTKNITSGMYVLKINCDGYVMNEKVIVSR
ncbi:MAG: T9SS type A sorting domain-containing protein [Chitinophagales bacterium]|nr:T9SS type A sorting domain-containing protein [Chitinophagales bacterium]